ncbi:MAG: acetyl-CoA carboxylase biotin carboxyl carrier protein [Pseudomonadota bacterium]
MSKKHQDADVAFIEALAELVSAKDLAEVQVKRDYEDNTSLNVRVTRTFAAPAMPVSAPAPAPVVPVAQAAAAPAADATVAAAPSADPADDPGAIPSPMVGTIYMQPEPGAQPFISIGEKVAEGQTLLIVEAMKTMNQIPAPRAGTVKRILVDDGAAVEFGTPLVILD